ncbi:T9SS type A sorting domain-containing protein [bacterium]|nr:T9SS type A sorting domain-containing protein [bacterium]
MRIALVLCLVIIITSFAAVKVPFIERFTNISCGYCPACGDTIDAIHDDYGDDINVIEIHVDWPTSSDPFYVGAPEATEARWSHYSVTGVPSVAVDGKKLSSWGATRSEVVAEISTATNLGLNAVFADSGLIVTLDVEASIVGTNNRLFVAVAQDENYLPSAPNGEFWIGDALMSMFPDEDGQVVDLSTVGTQDIFIPIIAESRWVVAYCRYVVWVQDMSAATTGYNVHNSCNVDMPDPPYFFSFEPGVTNGVIWADTAIVVLGDGAVIENMGTNSDDYVITLDKYLPASWSASFCAGSSCFPDSGLITLAAGDTADVAIDFYPSGPGVGSVQINITSLNSGMTESAVYTLSHSPSVLLVDDDKGNSYETYYSNALTNLGEVFMVHNREEGTLSSADLAGYEIVIWFTSADWSDLLSTEDQTAIGDYLDAGGKLFMSSQDLGYYCDTEGISSWYGNRFKATYLTDDSGVYNLTASSTGPFAGTSLALFTGDGAAFTPYPSTISTTGGGVECFNYSGTTDVAGVIFDGTYRLVYFAFPFEAINGETVRNDLMDDVLSFLREGMGISDGVNLPAKPLIVSASPNPFNSAVSLEFELAKKASVSLDVYDLSGRHVAQIIDSELGAGLQRAIWNGKSTTCETLPSGVYLVRLITEEKSTTRKILLAK